MLIKFFESPNCRTYLASSLTYEVLNHIYVCSRLLCIATHYRTKWSALWKYKVLVVFFHRQHSGHCVKCTQSSDNPNNSVLNFCLSLYCAVVLLNTLLECLLFGCVSLQISNFILYFSNFTLLFAISNLLVQLALFCGIKCRRCVCKCLPP